jgi:outer membrane pore protein F
MMYTCGKRYGLLCLAIGLLPAFSSQALVLHEDADTNVELYGFVAPAAFVSNNKVYEAYYSEQSVIDDTRASLGVNGNYQDTFFRLELDYDRENFNGGNGEMVLAVDKVYVGYEVHNHHSIAFGLMNTALDDVDRYADLGVDSALELPTSQDQDQTIKYTFSYESISAAASFTYKAESLAREAHGDTWTGYLGYEHDLFGVRLGAEARNGSEGESRFGKAKMLMLGARVIPLQDLTFAINAYKLNVYIAQEKFFKDGVTQEDLFVTDEDKQRSLYAYNRYEEQKWKGYSLAAQYDLSEQLSVSATNNFEQRQEWDKNDEYWDGNEDQWLEHGESREWRTYAVKYKPNTQTEVALEVSPGDAAQNGYVRFKMYF